MQNVFVTGAAGFIGSTLVDRLLADGLNVTGWDNFSTGQARFLDAALQSPRFRLVRGDTLDLPALTAAMRHADFVFHLAANADIKDGWSHPRKDLEQNTIATFNVLEAMRANAVRRIAFSSTGSTYGESTQIPTPEDAPFPVQTSLYAASKVAGETLLSSYAEGGQLDEAYIFRFVSILGERYTHGHVFDFYRQLIEHPDRLKVLGDGQQRKSYLYVQDCVDALLHVTRARTAKDARHRTQIYNLGTPEYVQVNQSIGYICSALGLKPKLEYSGGDRGWIGDNPFIFLDTAKIQATGWKPRLTIEQGIVRTLRWLEANRWVYEARLPLTMHIVILGLWHLGSVTAACLARHHRVTGLDFDEPVLAGLRQGHAPLQEPGLDDLLAAGVAGRQLSFSSDPRVAATADALWVCYDTPVDAEDRSDLDWVHARLSRVLPGLPPGTVVLVSSQLPVGTCAQLALKYPQLHFACSPENLRLGSAIAAFEQPARIVVGTSSPAARATLEKMLAPLGAPLVWMRPESAEMVKHALNSFLALSITYINEIATLSEAVGADAGEVAAGLKSDPRIGSRAYLAPGGPFAGGTLARDVVTLGELGAARHVPLALIPAIKASNDRHRDWAFHKVQAALAGIERPIVVVLGLAYTPNTSTLRRSAAVELCRKLLAAGRQVRAFDPLIRTADAEHRDLPLAATAAEALRGAHAVVICTEWPEFRDYPWPALLAGMARPVVVDASRLIEKSVAAVPGLVYLTVGRP